MKISVHLEIRIGSNKEPLLQKNKKLQKNHYHSSLLITVFKSKLNRFVLRQKQYKNHEHALSTTQQHIRSHNSSNIIR